MKTLAQLEAEIRRLKRENAALRSLTKPGAVVYDEAKHEPLPGPGYAHKGVIHVAGCPCSECTSTRRRNVFGGRAGS